MELGGTFGPLDALVVLGVLVATTVVGERLAGRQGSLSDFFLGGGRLPWWAVAASIVATEISAVTYVSLPSVVQREGGDLTYLQIGLIGSLVARAVVGWLLVPAYYERRIYSPYDYVGERLGEGTRRTTTVLFTVGGLLGQSARVYMTAVVLEVVLHGELAWLEQHTGLPPLAGAVATIGLVAVLWTWMGGIAAVVWTDAILFLLFLVGIGVTLGTVHGALPGGLDGALAEGLEQGKLRVFDPSWDPTRAYTLWAALIASSWGGIGSYGTDQLMAQRLFCCRGPREARRAILASYAAVLLIALVALVGVALWAYLREHPLEGAAAALVAEKPDRVFPVFISTVLSSPWRGLVLAGIFAAAISSLDSILAALSQTTLSALVQPWRERSGRPAWTDRQAVRASRALVLVWGACLCLLAVGIEGVAQRYASILDLALAMAGYTGGALLAAFFLAFLPTGRDARGFPQAAALSVLTVFAVSWHARWAWITTLVLGLAIVAWWALGAGRRAGLPRLAFLVLGAALAVWLARHGTFEREGVERSVAWPWYVPIGSTVALVTALVLSGARAGQGAGSSSA